MMKKFAALLLCLALLAGAVLPASAASLPQEAGLSAPEWDVLLLTNRERVRAGLRPVSTTPFLQRACDIRAEELCTRMSHTRPDGSSCFTVLSDRYTRMGENIAAGYAAADDVMQGWMNSAGHRDNILSPNYAHMGVGYHYRVDSAYRSYWVQFFYTGVDCAYTSVRLAGGNGVAAACKSIDEARLTLALDCGCGTCYLPLMRELCSGFVPGRLGTQTLTVSVCGMTAQIEIVVSQDGSAETFAGFVDVSAGAWYASSIQEAVSRGLMNGVGNGCFEPEGSMTRAMLVTVLWRYEGEPQTGANCFRDVPDGAWYTDAVAWAAAEGIVGGVGNGCFEPGGAVTREQIAAILFRCAQKNGHDSGARAGLSGFPDAWSVDGYAQEAVGWAVAEGVMNGSDGLLLPQGNATRAQVATLLIRYIRNIAESKA